MLSEYINAVANLEPADRRRLESLSGELIEMDIDQWSKEEIFERLFGDRNITAKRERFYMAARNMGRMLGN